MSIFLRIKCLAWASLLGLSLSYSSLAQSSGSDPATLEQPVQVKINKMVLEGNTQLGDEDFADILDGYQNRLLDFEDIRRVAEAIVTRYREKDFLTVSAYLPEQDLSDGEITIKIIEAKIGKVTVEGAKHYDERFIRWLFDPALKRQEKGELLRRSEVQRQLLLLNDNLDLSVRSVLQESAEEGVVDLVLQAQDSRPIHFGFDYNNLGAETTGRNRLGASFEWGDFTNRGDILSLRYVESDLLNADTDGIDLINAGYTTPINNKGTYFDFSYANSAFQAGQEFEVLDIRGSADVFRLGLRHKLIRSLDKNLELSASFILQNIENTVLGSQTSRDRLRELTLGVSGDWAGLGGRNFGSALLTQDLGGFLNGSSAGDPLSSRGAGGGFTKLNFNLSRIQRLNDLSYLILRGSHQTTFAPLPFAEQFSLGGISSVRGFNQSSYLGDRGYTVSAEVRFAPIKSNRQLFEVGAFIDHGEAAVTSPAPGEIPNGSLTGAGVTFQFRLPKQTSIRADIGWPVASSPALSDVDDGPVPYLIFSKRF